MSSATPKFSLLERTLAYASAAIIIVTVLSFIVTLVVGLAGGRHLLAAGLWPAVTWISFYGLPIGFLLLVVLLIISYSRRGSRRRGDRE